MSYSPSNGALPTTDSGSTTPPVQGRFGGGGNNNNTASSQPPALNPSQQHQLEKLKKSKVELTFSEGTKARALFMSQTNEYLTSKFQLRTVLSQMGLYPSDQELGEVLSVLNNKLDFASFTKYLTFLKVKYMRPEPKDLDTVRAFAALGGNIDRQGNISVENLRENCKKFSLTIDIDSMINEADDDASGLVDFAEFKAMWDPTVKIPSSPRNNNPSTGSNDQQQPNNNNQQHRPSSDASGGGGQTAAEGGNTATAQEILEGGAGNGGGGMAMDDAFADEMMELLDRSDDGDDFGTLDEQMRRLRERHSPTRYGGETKEEAALLVSPRQLARKQSAILRNDGEGDENEILAILHHYLRLPDRNNAGNHRETIVPKIQTQRQSMQRRMSQRKSIYSRLPSIGRTNSVLINSATAAQQAAAATQQELNNTNAVVDVVSDEDGAGLDASLSATSPMSSARRTARSNKNRTITSTTQSTSNSTGGYRAPSPVTLSQYNALKGRPDAKLSPAKGPRPPPITPRGTVYSRR